MTHDEVEQVIVSMEGYAARLKDESADKGAALEECRAFMKRYDGDTVAEFASEPQVDRLLRVLLVISTYIMGREGGG